MFRSTCAQVGFCMICAAVLLAAADAWTEQLDLDPPAGHAFLLDAAELLSSEDARAIEAICGKLLKEKGSPMIVVTIESMADHGGANMRIEAFAKTLLRQWGPSREQTLGENWNSGLLFLVSVQDRKARIELGPLWSQRHVRLTQRIMDEQIIPRFKRGAFSDGVRAGATALDRMARGLPVPSKPPPRWVFIPVFGCFALILFTAISFIRRGPDGWAAAFWGAIFRWPGAFLYNAHHDTKRRRPHAGGFSGLSGVMGGRVLGGGITGLGGGLGGRSFGGGSSGGGFSGGGGATGSW